MGVTEKMLLFMFLLLPALEAALPRFEVHWESEKSYVDNDPLVSPWFIRLGDINVGPPGYLEGPNVVTIDSADYCVEGCQESWPDEFCSKYPPEGVPNKPRAVEDWGTKYNITGDLMTEGIKSIHERGGQVVLSYGGRHTARPHEWNGGAYRSGIAAQGGGGETYVELTQRFAQMLAERIHNNIVDWNLDGVDFYHLDITPGNPWSGSAQDPGTSATYAKAVLRHLRALVGNTKTISYSTRFHQFSFDHPDMAIISAIHPYLDFITLDLSTPWTTSEPLSEEMLIELDFLGIPLSKIGIMMALPSSDSIDQIVGQVKELGMAGVSLYSINAENESFRGELAQTVAEALYGA